MNRYMGVKNENGQTKKGLAPLLLGRFLFVLTSFSHAWFFGEDL